MRASAADVQPQRLLHTLSAKQYTRRNAVQSLMIVANLVYFSIVKRVGSSKAAIYLPL